LLSRSREQHLSQYLLSAIASASSSPSVLTFSAAHPLASADPHQPEVTAAPGRIMQLLS
jgi:hypothetical protein